MNAPGVQDSHGFLDMWLDTSVESPRDQMVGGLATESQMLKLHEKSRSEEGAWKQACLQTEPKRNQGQIFGSSERRPLVNTLNAQKEEKNDNPNSNITKHMESQTPPKKKQTTSRSFT